MQNNTTFEHSLYFGQPGIPISQAYDTVDGVFDKWKDIAVEIDPLYMIPKLYTEHAFTSPIILLRAIANLSLSARQLVLSVGKQIEQNQQYD